MRTGLIVAPPRPWRSRHGGWEVKASLSSGRCVRASGGLSTEGLDELLVQGLEPEAALELVAAAAEDVAPDAARSLVRLTNGNPLALLELPRLLTQPQRDGREPLEQPLPASQALQNAFGRRLERLPDEARAMLLIAAASDSDELATILRAWQPGRASQLTLDPAERAGLESVDDGRLEFRHPLCVPPSTRVPMPSSAVRLTACWPKR